MYEEKEGSIKINQVRIHTFARKVRHVNTDLVVEAGTTGPRGYVPRARSSRAYVAIGCLQGDFLFDPILNRDGRVVGIEIACCGDGALTALAESLEFAAEALLNEEPDNEETK